MKNQGNYLDNKTSIINELQIEEDDNLKNKSFIGYLLCSVDNKYQMIYVKYYEYIQKKINNNKNIYYSIFFLILLSIIIYIFLSDIILICKDIYDDCISNLHKNRINNLKYTLEYKCKLNNNLINNMEYTEFNKIDILILNKKLKFECICLYNNIPNRLNIAKSIIDEIHLSFRDMINVSTVNSPIIDQVNYNTNSLLNIHTVNQEIPNNPLGIQGIYGNKNSLVVSNNFIIGNNHRKTELLNYQSNILYILLNGLSPSIY